MNGEALLDALLEYLVGHPAKNVACEGHSGSEESDASGQYLSQQRARAVQQALLEGGLEFSRITAVGYGGTHPLVSDGVVLGRSARVEIVISDS
jgi:outer membrane protein OmpA-like peptidoglycan-associated protein